MNETKRLAIPVLVLAIGIGWLLNVLKWIPSVDWVWTIGLAVAGVATLLCGGMNKVTVVVGPFLLASSVFAFLRQTGRIRIDIEVPCLVIALGALLLTAQLTNLPAPEWLKADRPQDS